MARGHVCNSVRVVGSSLTCFPLLWCLIGACSSKEESLSVSISYSDECCDVMTAVWTVIRLLFDDGVRLGAFVIFVTKGNNEAGSIRKGMM